METYEKRKLLVELRCINFFWPKYVVLAHVCRKFLPIWKLMLGFALFVSEGFKVSGSI